MTLVSRRQAVYLTGTGLTAATVTACAPKVQPAGNDASPSPGGTASAESAVSAAGASPSSASDGLQSSGKNYQGPVKLEKYDSKGEFKPGTREHKAENVPAPVEPENMYEESVDGMYSFIAFWVEAQNYLYLTGDGALLRKADPADDYTESIDLYKALYDSGVVWVLGEQHPMKISLNSAKPVKNPRSETSYMWIATVEFGEGTEIYNSQTQETYPLNDLMQSGSRVSVITQYENGAWRMLKDDGSQASPGGTKAP
mgnify:FL=1|jgi:hypothetical protein